MPCRNDLVQVNEPIYLNRGVGNKNTACNFAVRISMTKTCPANHTLRTSISLFNIPDGWCLYWQCTVKKIG